MPAWIAGCVPRFVAVLLLAAALLASWLQQTTAPWPWLETVRIELISLASHRQDQWLAALCVGVYLAGFAWLADATAAAPRGWRQPRALLLALFVLCGSAAYALDYSRAASTTHFVTLLFALACGQGAAFWQVWEMRRERPRLAGGFVLAALALLITAACLIHPGAGIAYQYRGELRWKGPWDNPNTFGLLTAVALVLSLGLALDAWRRRDLPSTALPPRLRRALPFAWLVCAAIAADGLVHSYSRAAWLGAALGPGWWTWTELRGATDDPATASPRLVLLRQCAPSLLVLALSLGVIAFWTFRHTEIPLVRRAFSVGNPDDFSWRNRVDSIPGSLEVIARKPLTGWGWNRPVSVFDHGHLPAHMSESGAVTLNSYLVLGMTLGLPALFAFLGWVWLGWRDTLSPRRTRGEGRGEGCSSDSAADPLAASDSPPRSPLAKRGEARDGVRGSSPHLQSALFDPLRLLARAALLPLLVGFALDGGLFKLALAVPFCVLLELSEPPPNGN